MKQQHKPCPSLGNSESSFGELTGVPSGTDAPAAAPAVAGQGAPPTNRAPYKDNGDGEIFFQPLRWGIDTLELSYPGTLKSKTESKLINLKAMAQSADVGEVALAQFKIGDHIFEVKDKGSKLFPYILEDNSFRISLSKCLSTSLPLAFVHVSSGYLASATVEAIEADLRGVLQELAAGEEEKGPGLGGAGVSRIDLFVDFASTWNMEDWDRGAWLTRAKKIEQYAVDGKFSGWAIGRGAAISARLYQKLLEILTSGKVYLLDLWKKAGWDGITPVWRLEFQLRRAVLDQLGLKSLGDALRHLSGIWSYCTTDWLRLTVSNPTDTKRSRWPSHLLWDAISSVDWETQGGPLCRQFSKTRAPGDEWIYQTMLQPVIAVMARDGISDLESAIDRTRSPFIEFHEERSHQAGKLFSTYIREKVQLKARQYNTVLNPKIEGETRQWVDDYAEEYRRRSGR
jgi:hypothetical protein